MNKNGEIKDIRDGYIRLFGANAKAIENIEPAIQKLLTALDELKSGIASTEETVEI